MSGKLLIVEDEPIVAIDLRDELREMGFEVTGLAESADSAMMSVEEDKPDLVLMDISIDGSMDGIQTARVLRDLYEVPVVFLTSYSDSETISRATRETPYGYLTKPFKSRDLQAMLRTAVFKAVRDAAISQSHQAMTLTLQGAHEALVMISANGEVEFMNRSAEELTGLSLLRARGMLLGEVVDLVDLYKRPLILPAGRRSERSDELFGWMLRVPGRELAIVDFTLRPIFAADGSPNGFVLSLRDATERIRNNFIEVSQSEARWFESVPMGMVQLDAGGRVMRVNDALLREVGVPMESLVGRTLSELLADPEPLVSRRFMHMLLQPARDARRFPSRHN
jgi:PAS domain S-box-containing protein